MIISVKVYPGSKVQKIIRVDDKFKIYLKSIPKNNEANNELVDLIARHFNVSKSQILIIRGLKSPHKVLKIND